MKRSHYTYACQLDSDYALFNTSTGRFALCDKQYADALDDVANADEAIVAELAEAGFVVDDDYDEIEVQQAFFEAARTSRDQLWLTIAPTYACNCRCAYCYEQDKMTAKSLMGKDVEDAIYAFVQERFATTGFKSIFVEWYGGDPQLCLDLVERMSSDLIAFCEERGLGYDSMMLSNATRIKEDEASLLSRSRVSSMLITIDGPEDLHNKRRPAIDVENPYRSIMSAIDALTEQGIAVSVAMNADKVNMARYEELRQDLDARGVNVAPTKLNNYSQTFNCPGEKRFCSPDFDLYTHEEFAHANYEALARNGFTAAQLGGMLSPSDHFCSGQLEASYVIDAFGDVYKCDGRMGDKNFVLFNLLDWARAEEPDRVAVHDAIAFDPFENEACAACELLPTCWGNCYWERERCNWPCHPLRYTFPRYLDSYRACFPPRTAPFEVLA